MAKELDLDQFDVILDAADPQFAEKLREAIGLEPGETCAIDVPAFTASLDAAIALVERVLPGWKWRVSANQGEVFQRDPECGHDGFAANPAIALLIATLKALQEKHNER